MTEYLYAVIEDFERDEEDHTEPQMFVIGEPEQAMSVRNELELLEYAFNENEDTLKSLITDGKTIAEAIELLRQDFDEEFDADEGYYVVAAVTVSGEGAEVIGVVD